MFHSSVTGMLPLYSGARQGLCMSIFNTGGTFSFALGPVFISWYVGHFGLEAMPYTIIFGFISILVCLKAIPMPVSEGFKSAGFWGSLKETRGDVWKPIAMIWVVMVLRAVAGQSFITHLLMTPALLLYLYLPGSWVYAARFSAASLPWQPCPWAFSWPSALPLWEDPWSQA